MRTAKSVTSPQCDVEQHHQRKADSRADGSDYYLAQHDLKIASISVPAA